MTSNDNYGFFGPEYSYADNIPLPGEVGVRRESSFGAILDAVSGINFYVDTIAFGEPSFFNRNDTRPMGIRYFLNTGMRCDNGASMSEYFDGVTKGNLLGDRVAKGLASAGLPGLRGLAPGMLENARDALDPRPLLAAVTATGYPVCQQVICPVGDTRGSIQNPDDPAKPYIIDPVQYDSGPLPTQTRWVQAYDSTGSPINLTKDEFGARPKCYNADGTYLANPPAGCPTSERPRVSFRATKPSPLCTVVQNPQLREGFDGLDGIQAEQVLLAVSVAAIGGVALWHLTR
jgi:hypothetical protein